MSPSKPRIRSIQTTTLSPGITDRRIPRHRKESSHFPIGSKPTVYLPWDGPFTFFHCQTGVFSVSFYVQCTFGHFAVICVIHHSVHSTSIYDVSHQIISICWVTDVINVIECKLPKFSNVGELVVDASWHLCFADSELFFSSRFPM